MKLCLIWYKFLTPSHSNLDLMLQALRICLVFSKTLSCNDLPRVYCGPLAPAFYQHLTTFFNFLSFLYESTIAAEIITYD